MNSMRYARYAIAAVLVASLIMVVPEVAYSQAKILAVKVDRGSYGEGETIMVSGTVPAVIEGVPVAIQVFNPRNTMYTIGQPTPNADGTYTFEFKVGGKLGISGIYTIKATYSGQSVQTTFEFTGGPSTVGPGIVEFEFEGKKYQVKATLSNGSIKGIELDPDFTSMIVSVSTTSDGELMITLPRELLDARLSGCEGEDDVFIALVDGDEAEVTESGTTATERTLTVPVSAGAEEVEIIGTCIVPEFGILAGLVLAASVGAIVVVSRRNLILKALPH